MYFFSKYKKIILIAGFAVIIFILGYLLYALFFKPPTSIPVKTEPELTPTQTGLPEAETGSGQIIEPGGQKVFPETQTEAAKTPSKIANGDLTQTTQLSQSPGAGTTLGSNGSDLQYHDAIDGKFYKITKDGEISALTDKIFHNVENITWSSDKNKAILEYPDGANIIYDFTNDKQITLPKHWKDFDFSPDSDQIVMKSMGLDPENRWLAISNSDGSKIRAIEALGEQDSTVFPSWSPNNQIIAMYTEGVSFNRQEIFFIGLNDENFKSAVIEGRGFQPKWSPKGDRLVYSVYSNDNNLKPMLWVVDAQGDNIGAGRKKLNLETWADKCSFASDYELYCAVPESLEEGAGLFPELAKNTSDILYKINTRTGVKKLVAIPDDTYNMSNLIISDNGYYLYFTDETTKEIYKIKLK